MEKLSHTVSLPKIAVKKNQSNAHIRKRQRLLKRINKSTVNRLYCKEIRKIKRNHNSYWNITQTDIKLEEKIDKLREQRSLIQIKPNSILNPNIAYTSEKKNSIAQLKKLQEKMKNLIDFKSSVNSYDSNKPLKKKSKEFIGSETGEQNLERISELIEAYKKKVDYVTTRIKIIKKSISELILKREKNHVLNQKNIVLDQKIHNLTKLLESYEDSEKKISDMNSMLKSYSEKQKNFLNCL